MVNNDYTHWEMYAIGGSADPTINSQGNRYLAPANIFAKEVNQSPAIFIFSIVIVIIMYTYIQSTLIQRCVCAGYEAGEHESRRVEGVELAVGGRPAAERRVLHPVRRRGGAELRQGVQPRGQAFFCHRQPHFRRRGALMPQAQPLLAQD